MTVLYLPFTFSFFPSLLVLAKIKKKNRSYSDSSNNRNDSTTTPVKSELTSNYRISIHGSLQRKNSTTCEAGPTVLTECVTIIHA